MPRLAARESDILETVLAGYEADGFDVFLHPSPSVLPAFLKTARPDAIAVRPGKKIAIEVKGSKVEASGHRSGLSTELFVGHPEWEFRVFYAPSRSPGGTVEKPTSTVIEQSISELRQLREAGYFAAALVMGWSVLEALARDLLPKQLERAQPPAKLVEILATEGLLTPSEADVIRKAATVRNTVAHGELGLAVEPTLLDTLIAALRTLSDLAARHRR
jgi:uncharacterized protein YutE (UPF0331/DUF86 family)